jgi:bacterioferritin-associated ferredoxin
VIVCICEGVSDSEIEQLIKNGASSVEDLKQECGAGGKCGGCLWQLVETLEREKALEKNCVPDMQKGEI